LSEGITSSACRITIARTNVLNIDKATERAKEILAVLYRGIDPKAGAHGDATLRSVTPRRLSVE
jgi:hypothetical protein